MEDRMDMKEASAMTEASGLPDDQEGYQSSFRPMQGASHQMRSGSPVMRLSERLRDMTSEAPLRSLFLAFLFGLWVARRR
jgi:hypothetical protein